MQYHIDYYNASALETCRLATEDAVLGREQFVEKLLFLLADIACFHSGIAGVYSFHCVADVRNSDLDFSNEHSMDGNLVLFQLVA